MTDTGSDERPAFCENCVKGFSWAGEATGSSRTLGAFKIVYVASAGETEGKPAVLLLTDVFGFDLPNPKLLADKIAEGTGFTVYVPDLFDGKPLAGDTFDLPQTPTEASKRGVLSKIKNGFGIVGIVPWFLRNRPATKLPAVTELVSLLRAGELGHSQVGAVGYCYGGKLVAELNKAGLTSASAFVHPSIVSKADVGALKTPSTFAIAEDDDFDAPMLAYVNEALAGGKIACETHTYPGTCHGFASRGDLRIDSVREGCEGALAQTIRWFTAHLA